jgi:hypothetical protein
MKPAQSFFIVAFILAALPAWAESACFTPEQRQAEQWLRLHSELMVIAVTCHQDSSGRSLSNEYVSFTRKNIRTLHKAEQTLMAYYKATSKRDPVERLDQFRTRLGNEESNKAAKMSAPEFCGLYRDDVAKFEATTAKALDAEIRNRTSVKPCIENIRKKKGK